VRRRTALSGNAACRPAGFDGANRDDYFR